jgi:hypothetical protein
VTPAVPVSLRHRDRDGPSPKQPGCQPRSPQPGWSPPRPASAGPSGEIPGSRVRRRQGQRWPVTRPGGRLGEVRENQSCKRPKKPSEAPMFPALVCGTLCIDLFSEIKFSFSFYKFLLFTTYTDDAVNRTEPFRSVTESSETETVGSVENPG